MCIRDRIFVGGMAKSRDGLVRTHGFRPSLVPVGQHVKVVIASTRPLGTNKQVTNLFLVQMYQGGKEPFLNRTFELDFIWAAIQLSPEERAKLSNEGQNKYIYVDAFRRNFQEGDFEGLDILFSRLNDPKELDTIGDWKLSACLSD